MTARFDKGHVRATRRDLHCIAWITEQYAARGDQIRRLLSRFPDPTRPFKDELIAETTVRDQISRWRRAGWIEYRRVLADEPGFAWVTRKGLQLVGLDEIYAARVPAYTRLDHLYAINQVRLWMDRKRVWKSERRFRSELDPKKLKDVAIPDGLVTGDNGLIAIEVEISVKKPFDLQAKLWRLVRQSGYHLGRGYNHAYSAIWFYVPDEKIKRAVESATQSLLEQDQQRISVRIEPDLIASRFR